MARTQVWVYALLIVLLVLPVIPGLEGWLRFDKEAILGGQSWRMVTAHFVHLGLSHALVNLVAMAILLAWAWRLLRFYEAGLFLLVSPLFLSLALLLMGIDWYAGLSGMLHGLVVFLLLCSSNLIRNTGLLLLLLKLMWQFQSIQSVTTVSDNPILHEAHWIGAILGAVFFLISTIWQSRP